MASNKLLIKCNYDSIVNCKINLGDSADGNIEKKAITEEIFGGNVFSGSNVRDSDFFHRI